MQINVVCPVLSARSEMSRLNRNGHCRPGFFLLWRLGEKSRHRGSRGCFHMFWCLMLPRCMTGTPRPSVGQLVPLHQAARVEVSREYVRVSHVSHVALEAPGAVGVSKLPVSEARPSTVRQSTMRHCSVEHLNHQTHHFFQILSNQGPRAVRFNVSFWTLTALIPGSQSVHVRQLLRKVVSAVVEDQAFVHFAHAIYSVYVLMFWYASTEQTSLTASVLSASLFCCSNWEFKTLPFPFLCKRGFVTLATEALLEASFALLFSVPYCQGFTKNWWYHSS